MININIFSIQLVTAAKITGVNKVFSRNIRTILSVSLYQVQVVSKLHFDIHFSIITTKLSSRNTNIRINGCIFQNTLFTFLSIKTKTTIER